LIQKLEDKVNRETKQETPIIFMETNDQLTGLEHLESIYQAILKRLVLKVTYKSFRSRTPSTFDFHPYILKEFNNRWFMVGKKDEGRNILNLALDRLISLDINLA